MPKAQVILTDPQDAIGVRPRVLVVDDEPALLKVTRRLLIGADIDVVTCNDGPEALRLLDSASFDAVISDVAMPHMSGIELLRALRRRNLTVPVILVTGGPSVETAIESIEHGAFNYLLKPVQPSKLIDAAWRAIQVGQAQAASACAGQTVSRDDESKIRERPMVFARALQSLCPAFEPIVVARDGTVFGYEVVVCSQEPLLVTQAALFEAAEQLGNVTLLFRQMCERACAVFTGDGLSQTQLFFNLHPSDLADAMLLDPRMPLLPNAHHIVLDVTERATLDQVPDVARRVAVLRDAGYRIAIDDLGAGYAALNNFAALEPEFVKLDATLIRGLHRSAMKQRLVELMTSLCHDMGTLVIAEGVQRRAERDTAVALGCDLLQGPLLGEPAHTLVNGSG